MRPEALRFGGIVEQDHRDTAGRHFARQRPDARTADARADALLALIKVELADAKAVLRAAQRVPRGPGRQRRQVAAAELFYDVDKPIERFVQIDGMPGMHPLHSVSGKEDTVTAGAGTVRPRGPSQLTTPSLPDPPPRAV